MSATGSRITKIEIGNSWYSFSGEVQRYLFPIDLADFDELWLGLPPHKHRCPDYEGERSIIFVSDPHANAAAQFRLFQGLEVFFRENPGLARRTIFLAEGYPANEPDRSIRHFPVGPGAEARLTPVDPGARQGGVPRPQRSGAPAGDV